MKNIPFFDIIFIVITAGVLFLLVHFGYSDILSRFSMIVALIAYYVGKYIGRIGLRKK